MKLLAIDTATEACSAALQIDGDTISRYRFAPREHANLILAMVDELLAEAGLPLNALDALAFGRGPGAFTGVRIATGVAQGLAFGADLPLIPVSTLAALAQAAAIRHSHIISAIDARMGEVYWCVYETGSDGIVVAAGEEQVGTPDTLRADANKPWFGIGSGWQTYAETFAKLPGLRVSGYEGDRYPNAKDMLVLARKYYAEGKAITAVEALPVYLRNKVTG